MVTHLSPTQIWAQLPRIEEVVLGKLEKGEMVNDSTVPILPKNLRTVYMSYSITKAGVEALSPEVSHIYAPQQLSDLAAQLPANLKSFTINGRNNIGSTYELAYSLPSKLTSLDLDHVTKMLPPSARLPPTLTYLACWSSFFHLVIHDSQDRRSDVAFRSVTVSKPREWNVSAAWNDILDLFPKTLRTLQLRTEPLLYLAPSCSQLWDWPTSARLLPHHLEMIKVISTSEDFSLKAFNTWTSLIPLELTRLHTLSLLLPGNRAKIPDIWSFEVDNLPTSITKLHLGSPISAFYFKALPPRLRSLALDPPHHSLLWTVEELQTLPKSLKWILFTSSTTILAEIRERILEALPIKASQIDFIWAI
jgi:hypothetical protein